jgi:hypothetical protein
MRTEGRPAADAILRFGVPRALRVAAKAAAALEAQTLCVGFATRPARERRPFRRRSAEGSDVA